MFFGGREIVEVGTWKSQCSECGYNYLGGLSCKGCGVVFKGAALTYMGIEYPHTHFHELPIVKGYE